MIEHVICDLVAIMNNLLHPCWDVDLLEVWRLRVYQSESMIAPAKPLWYLREGLNLHKGECRRVV